jgi:putative DNA primase/helicase
MRSYGEFGIEIPELTAGREARARCPRCSEDHPRSRSKTLSVNVEKGVWVCFRCRWTGGLRGGHIEGDTTGRGPAGSRLLELPSTELSRRRLSLRRTWAGSRPVVADDPVARYLSGRGLALQRWPAAFRHHPRLPYCDEEGHLVGVFPALLARVDAPDGRPVCVHRTYLTPDGRKAPLPAPRKLMSPALPGSLRGAAIRLFEPDDVLLLAEGIETALAGYVATSIPAWSALSASGLENVLLPPRVRRVYILADLDPNGRGEAAARALARRLLLEGRDARILRPEGPAGSKVDWNDVLMR